MSNIVRGSLINIATRIAVVAMGLGITLVTARLGTQQQGTFALFTAVESILLMLFSGFGIALARRVSHHRERPGGLAGAIVIFCVAAGSLASCVLLGISVYGPPGYSVLWILAFAAPLLLIAPNLSGIWLGLGRMGALARISLAAPMLTLLGVGLAFVLGMGPSLATVLWSWVLAKMVVGAGALVAARRSHWLGKPDFGAMKPELSFVATIGATNLVGLMNYKIDLFLVQHFLGLSATGIYSIAVIAAELLWFVSSSVTQAAYARIGTPDNTEASRIVIRVVHGSFLALLMASPVLWATASILLPWLLGEEYRPAIAVLAVLLPGVLVYGAASALSAYFTNHAGRPLISAALASMSLAINFILSWVLIPQLGMVGGAIATSVSYLVSIMVAFWIFLRLSGTPVRTLLSPDWFALRQDLRRLRIVRGV